MIKTPIDPAKALIRAASGTGGGNGGTNVPETLTKMGTFAKAVALEEYGIDKGFGFESGLIFPLIGINHLVTRGIFQPLERMNQGLPDQEMAGTASSTAGVAFDKPDSFFEDADKHINDKALEALKNCVIISKAVTGAEIEGRSIASAITTQDLQTAELGLRGLNEAIQNLAIKNPDVNGLDKLASDMNSVATHYQTFTKQLMPKLGTSLRHEPPQA